MAHRLLPDLVDRNKSNLLDDTASVNGTNEYTPPRSTTLSLRVISPYARSLYPLIQLIDFSQVFSRTPSPTRTSVPYRDLFLPCAQSAILFFHEPSFRQRLADGALPDCLKFAVFATALRFSEDLYYNGASHEACTSYAKESWKQIVSVWFAPEADPDVYICQAITLLSIVDFTGKQLL